MCSVATQTISGRVLRTNTRTFTFDAHMPRSNTPEVGQFVETEPLTIKTSSQLVTVVGVFYKFETEEDSITRQLSVAEPAISSDEIAWQRSRLILIDVSVLKRASRTSAMGLCRSHRYAAMMCSDHEARVLTQSPRFLRVMLEARDLIDLDSLIVATIESVSRVYPN